MRTHTGSVACLLTVPRFSADTLSLENSPVASCQILWMRKAELLRSPVHGHKVVPDHSYLRECIPSTPTSQHIGLLAEDRLSFKRQMTIFSSSGLCGLPVGKWAYCQGEQGVVATGKMPITAGFMHTQDHISIMLPLERHRLVGQRQTGMRACVREWGQETQRDTERKGGRDRKAEDRDPKRETESRRDRPQGYKKGTNRRRGKGYCERGKGGRKTLGKPGERDRAHERRQERWGRGQLERESLSPLGNRRKAHTSSKHSIPCSVLPVSLKLAQPPTTSENAFGEVS